MKNKMYTYFNYSFFFPSIGYDIDPDGVPKRLPPLRCSHVAASRNVVVVTIRLHIGE